MIDIRFNNDSRDYRPGDRVAGTARWQVDTSPDWIEARLYWHTMGRGDTDIEVIDTKRFQSNMPSGEERFEFLLPDSPLSYNGELLAINWGVEIVIDDPDEHKTEEFILTHGSGPIRPRLS